MATRTSTQTGNWNDTATWGGAAAPGDGDIAVISSGHTVTVTATQTVGDDTNLAITCVGNLTVNAPLTIKSGTNAIAISQQRSSTVTVSRVGSNTGSITFNPASGVTPHWDTPNTGSGTPSIVITGESGDRVPISTSLARSGNRCYFDFTAFAPTIDWDFVAFTDMGGTGDTSSTRFISYTGQGSDSVMLDYCRFVTCGKVFFNFIAVTGYTFDVKNCDWRSGRHSHWFHAAGDNRDAAETRRFKDCTAHDTSSRSILLRVPNLVCDGGAYSNTIIEINGGTFVTLSSNLLQNCAFFDDITINGQVQASTDGPNITDNAFLTNCDNPHSVSIVTGTPPRFASIVQKNVADGFNLTPPTDAGDFVLSDGPVLIDRNICINMCGVLFPVLFTTVSVTARRNTCYRAAGSANAGESTGWANAVLRFTSNLFVSMGNGIHQDAGFASQQYFICDYNGFYDMTTAGNVDHPTADGGSPVNSYLGAASTAAWWNPSVTYGSTNNRGLHDVYGDPQFVDSSRTAVSWYNSVFGSGGSYANVRAEMLKLNGTAADGSDASFTAGFHTAAYVAYIRAGFTPQNSIYARAGDPADGSPDIGAVDFSTKAVFPSIQGRHFSGAAL